MRCGGVFLQCSKPGNVSVFEMLQMAHERDSCIFYTKLQAENFWIHVSTICGVRGATKMRKPSRCRVTSTV